MSADNEMNAVAKLPDEVLELEDSKVDRNPETNRLALAQNMSPEDFLAAEKSLKRKLDLQLLTCMWFIFILNYLDRVSFFSLNNENQD